MFDGRGSEGPNMPSDIAASMTPCSSHVARVPRTRMNAAGTPRPRARASSKQRARNQHKGTDAAVMPAFIQKKLDHPAFLRGPLRE